MVGGKHRKEPNPPPKRNPLEKLNEEVKKAVAARVACPYGCGPCKACRAEVPCGDAAERWCL